MECCIPAMWLNALGSYSVPSAEIRGVLSQVLCSKDSDNIENAGVTEPFQGGSGSCLQLPIGAVSRERRVLQQLQDYIGIPSQTWKTARISVSLDKSCIFKF